MTAECFAETDFGTEDHAPAARTVPLIDLWLVDDNRRLRATLSELLTKEEGIRCTGTFSSPNAVLSALASRMGPDVILLDVNMGEASGLDAIRPIKSLSRSTHVLMFTTFFDDMAEKRALSSGASGFLLKSFPLDRILTSIRETWRKPAPHPRRPMSVAAMTPPTLDSSRVQMSSTREADRQPTAREQDGRSRLLWIKRCLDKIRNVRN